MVSRTRPTRRGEGADFAIAHGLVGIGEPVDPPPRTLAEAVLAVTEQHGEKAGRIVQRFAGVPDGVFVWTCQSDGRFRLGRIAGPWRYDDSAPARAVGIHHVRPAAWAGRPLPADAVPAGVRQTFKRGGRNFQRTHDRAAERETERIWRDADLSQASSWNWPAA